MWKRDADTGLILRNATTGILCNTCCFVPTLAMNLCCCYMDPDPPAYSSAITYSIYYSVKYSDKYYYSKGNNNLNHTPSPSSAYWGQYWPCGNEDWDSISPFGGVGKVPYYYGVSFDIQHKSTEVATGKYILNRLIGTALLYHSFPGPYNCCSWQTMDEVDCEGSGDYIGVLRIINTFDSTDITTLRNLFVLLALEDGGISCIGDFPEYGCWKQADYIGYGAIIGSPLFIDSGECHVMPEDVKFGTKVTACMLTGTETCVKDVTASGYRTEWNDIISWRPLDCDYKPWKNTVNYAGNDCVGHNGYFWRCCSANGPDTPAGIQEPSGVSTSCTGSNYWRIVA